MALLYYDESDEVNKVNIDELYERDHNRNLKKISTFNKILNRILKRINVAGKCIRNDKYIFYNIPDYIFGEPTYNKADCIAYVITKLEDNNFDVKYIHPNCLLISWEQFVPTFMRNEIRKKNGIILDEKGNIIKRENDEEEINNLKDKKEQKEQKTYTPLNNYKPTGRLIYNEEYFDKLKNKIS
jgi:hypothetical protein